MKKHHKHILLTVAVTGIVVYIAYKMYLSAKSVKSGLMASVANPLGLVQNFQTGAGSNTVSQDDLTQAQVDYAAQQAGTSPSPQNLAGD